MYNMLPALSKYLEVLCVVLLLINCFKLNSCVDAVQNSKPNIVLIIADDAVIKNVTFLMKVVVLFLLHVIFENIFSRVGMTSVSTDRLKFRLQTLTRWPLVVSS